MENFKSIIKNTLWFIVPLFGIGILIKPKSFVSLDGIVLNLSFIFLAGLIFIAVLYILRTLRVHGFGRIAAICLSFEFYAILVFLLMQNSRFNDYLLSGFSSDGFGAYLYLFLLGGTLIISFVTRALISTKGQPFFSQKWSSEAFRWLVIIILFVLIVWLSDRIV